MTRVIDKTTPLIFTHIQKNAGNTFAAILRAYRKLNKWNTLAISGNASVFTPVKILELFSDAHLVARNFHLITGHVPFATAMTCFAPGRFVTILRDPVSRMLSDYCSQPANSSVPKFGLEKFEELMSSKVPLPEFALDNLQVRMLCDDPRFGERASQEMLHEAKRNLSRHYCFGLAENVPAFADRIADQFALPQVKVLRLNTTWKYESYITDAIRERAKRHNEYDLELYDWAKQQLEALDALIVPQRRADFPSVRSVSLLRFAERHVKREELDLEAADGVEMILGAAGALRIFVDLRRPGRQRT